MPIHFSIALGNNKGSLNSIATIWMGIAFMELLPWLMIAPIKATKMKLIFNQNRNNRETVLHLQMFWVTKPSPRIVMKVSKLLMDKMELNQGMEQLWLEFSQISSAPRMENKVEWVPLRLL